jgi:hypothetical protein
MAMPLSHPRTQKDKPGRFDASTQKMQNYYSRMRRT